VRGVEGGLEGRGAAAPDDAEGCLVRRLEIPAGTEAGYLANWGPARTIPAPPGARAGERRHRGTDGLERVQRLAVASGIALHWSAPDPPGAAAEQTWSRLVARMGPEHRTTDRLA
jgi:hypothetical protein